ncbi:MAG: DUF1116 domain-containing protein [Gammaproteobacteria bacterium]|nr:DUF1116 domain-containing protein [Gammaproteobacteria bacterium]
MTAADMLRTGPVVVGVGLRMFVDQLRERGHPAIGVDWKPPRELPGELRAALEMLDAPSARQRIETANEIAVRRMLDADPVLVDVRAAVEVIPALQQRLILHAGPPIEWSRMCGPMRGAIAGAVVFEGWADDLDSALALVERGEVAFAPNHHFDAVGPMTGMTTAHMPVLVVENRRFGNKAYCTINEGLGKVMRFGGNDASVLSRLRWLAAALAPLLAAGLREADGLPLKNLVARGLSMGDEMHQRNVACTSLTLRALAPALVRAGERLGLTSSAVSEALAFIAGNDQFFLNLAMVMGKAIMDPVRDIEHSSVVTAMCRNGTDFGVRLSGTGDRWFVAPVEMPRGLYFPGFGAEDANPDMGDSTIVETIGLGGFAMAAAPAVAGFVGAGNASAATDFTRRMYGITLARNPEWTIPALDFAGVPTGIDARSVVRSGVPPTINTGIAHREPGIGQVGAGVVNAPIGCFEQALMALAERIGVA